MGMPTLKLVLLGDLSVGKSSLVHRFAIDSFDPHLPNTIGAAFISKEHTSNARRVKFEVWDTAGQERYKSLTPMYYRNAKVALVCFDLSNAGPSFERARYWCEQLAVLGPENIEIVIVGTKLDLNGAADILVTEYCADKGLRYMATSAKLDQGVTELFDYIVDGLDEEIFRELDSGSADSPQEAILLLERARSSRCC